AYDPAFAYEIAVIIQEGIRRMYERGESVFYYLTLGNENYPMEPMPDGAVEGILRGMYKFRPAALKASGGGVKSKVHLLGSGAILHEAMRAQTLLAEKFEIAADVWSVTSYKELRRDALECERWNRLHPSAEDRRSYVEKILGAEKGVFVAASDYMKSVPEMIARWVPGGLTPLGTDGFGRSETRPALRRHFEVDAECIAVAALGQLAPRAAINPERSPKPITCVGLA